MAFSCLFLMALAIFGPGNVFGKGLGNLGAGLGSSLGSGLGNGIGNIGSGMSGIKCALGLCPNTTPQPITTTTTITTTSPSVPVTTTTIIPTTSIPPTITSILPTTTVTTVLPPTGTPGTVTTTGPTQINSVTPTTTTTTITSPTTTTTTVVPVGARSLRNDASDARSRRRTKYKRTVQYIRIPRRRRLMRNIKVPASEAKRNRRLRKRLGPSAQKAIKKIKSR